MADERKRSIDPAGFVLLYRKLLDSPVFANEGLLKVWTWCLLRASYTRRYWSVPTGRGQTTVEILPGQFIFGRKTAADELGMRASTVHDRIRRLEQLGCVRLQPNSHYTVVTVVNWELYQGDGIEPQQPTGNEATTNRQPSDTNNKVNQVTRARSFDGAIDLSFEEEAEFKRIANRIAKVVPCAKPANRSLVAKTALLAVRGELSRDDVEQAIESVRLKQPTNAGAWFQKCLDNKAKRAGQNFNELLAATVLPAELLTRRADDDGGNSDRQRGPPG
jgi:DNA-binding Lrp family transcriptional regulator